MNVPERLRRLPWRIVGPVVAYVVLVLLGVTMSSIGISGMRQDPANPNGHQLGESLQIRSDEFLTSTPFNLGVTATGSPDSLNPLTAPHGFTSQLSSGPVSSVVFFDGTVLRLGPVLPDAWLIAARWWLPFLLLALGAPGVLQDAHGQPLDGRVRGRAHGGLARDRVVVVQPAEHARVHHRRRRGAATVQRPVDRGPTVVAVAWGVGAAILLARTPAALPAVGDRRRDRHPAGRRGRDARRPDAPGSPTWSSSSPPVRVAALLLVGVARGELGVDPGDAAHALPGRPGGDRRPQPDAGHLRRDGPGPVGVPADHRQHQQLGDLVVVRGRRRLGGDAARPWRDVPRRRPPRRVDHPDRRHRLLVHLGAGRLRPARLEDPDHQPRAAATARPTSWATWRSCSSACSSPACPSAPASRSRRCAARWRSWSRPTPGRSCAPTSRPCRSRRSGSPACCSGSSSRRSPSGPAGGSATWSPCCSRASLVWRVNPILFGLADLRGTTVADQMLVRRREAAGGGRGLGLRQPVRRQPDDRAPACRRSPVASCPVRTVTRGRTLDPGRRRERLEPRQLVHLVRLDGRPRAHRSATRAPTRSA